ncbi:lytic transglycosylase domain-containing protein [Novosphingobium sp. Gsoil 351]|uniref:lytic murein transglycosylase n=1 Tax=Novosphingobium sp. Gsoil 351 TaxID=2675225 RepID=UPI0012B455B2|nr:lytic murein transglycosylase [Novosphingobium sp. Gsoil 351]QGN53342.1 lytic murein transglycosylase [Novosphingobium sp. Gsoil 351]
MIFSNALRRWRVVACATILALGPAGPAVEAQDYREDGFPGYLQLLSARARGEGVSEATVTAMTAGLSFNPRVIDLDRSQPGNTSSTPSTFTAFEPYRRMHVDAARIAGGQRQYAALAGQGAVFERRFGVPLPVILAIWGHETNYGSYTGDFDLARSLATLAYEGRRRDLFAEEFIALLKMVDRGVPRAKLKGSWAGAFGNPQFLPSAYLRVATDGDGDGFADIWSSRADTVASIASYLRDAGWRAGEPWGVAVDVPAGLDRGTLVTRMASPRCAAVHGRHSVWKTMREWRALGITPQAGYWPSDTVLATLLEPDGPGRTAYLLTGNYRVILDYNCSNYYALSVGLLADAIGS